LGLTSFPIALKEQLDELLFKPWYDANPFYDVSYMGGMIPVPWYLTRFDINFGQVDKKDIAVPDMIKLIELYLQAPIPKDPNQILKLFEQAGLPVSEEYMVTIDSMYNDPHGQAAIGNVTPNQMGNGQYLPTADIGGGPIFNNQVMGAPPMDNPIYDDMMIDVRGSGNPFVPTNYRRSNQSQDWQTGRNYE